MSRVLVVDDDPHIRDAVMRSLEKLGVEVATADSAESALADSIIFVTAKQFVATIWTFGADFKDLPEVSSCPRVATFG